MISFGEETKEDLSLRFGPAKPTALPPSFSPLRSGTECRCEEIDHSASGGRPIEMSAFLPEERTVRE